MGLLDASLAQTTILYLTMVVAYVPTAAFPTLGHGDVTFATVAVALVVMLGMAVHQFRLSKLFDRTPTPLPQSSLRTLGALEGAGAVVFGAAFARSSGAVGVPEVAIPGTLLVAGGLLVAAGTGRSVGRFHWRSLAAGSYIVLGTGLSLFAVGLGIVSAGDPVLALSHATVLLVLGIAHLVVGVWVALDWGRLPIEPMENSPERASPVEETTA